MKESGLANDPAFDFLHFLDEPINATMGKLRILGLYYPSAGRDEKGYIPPSTIQLPPDAELFTFLHELGHRHGHYYHDDISEEYANNWANAHMPASMARPLTAEHVCQDCPEMVAGKSKVCIYCDLGGYHDSYPRAIPIVAPIAEPVQVIGSGSGLIPEEIAAYEPAFNELDKGELHLYVDRKISQAEIDKLEDEITSKEVFLTGPIHQVGNELIIPFQKRIAPLLIIGIAAVVIVGAVLGWGIFKTTQAGVPLWVWLVGGAALVYLFMQTSTGKAATQAVRTYIIKA
jgi:hypothetical protein